MLRNSATNPKKLLGNQPLNNNNQRYLRMLEPLRMPRQSSLRQTTKKPKP
jgi:hypothetical protein